METRKKNSMSLKLRGGEKGKRKEMYPSLASPILPFFPLNSPDSNNRIVLNMQGRKYCPQYSHIKRSINSIDRALKQHLIEGKKTIYIISFYAMAYVVAAAFSLPFFLPGISFYPITSFSLSRLFRLQFPALLGANKTHTKPTRAAATTTTTTVATAATAKEMENKVSKRLERNEQEKRRQAGQLACLPGFNNEFIFFLLSFLLSSFSARRPLPDFSHEEKIK